METTVPIETTPSVLKCNGVSKDIVIAEGGGGQVCRFKGFKQVKEGAETGEPARLSAATSITGTCERWRVTTLRKQRAARSSLINLIIVK